MLVAQSCPTLCDPRLQPARLLCPWDSPGENTRVGCRFLLQGIFLTESKPGLLPCRQIPFHLSQEGSWWREIPSLTEGPLCAFNPLSAPCSLTTLADGSNNPVLSVGDWPSEQTGDWPATAPASGTSRHQSQEVRLHGLRLYRRSPPCLLIAQNGQRPVPPSPPSKEGFAAQLRMPGQLGARHLLLPVCTHRKRSQGHALHCRVYEGDQAMRGYKVLPLRPNTGHPAAPLAVQCLRIHLSTQVDLTADPGRPHD